MGKLQLRDHPKRKRRILANAMSTYIEDRKESEKSPTDSDSNFNILKVTVQRVNSGLPDCHLSHPKFNEDISFLGLSYPCLGILES